MANWNGLQLTNKGIALQAKVQAGTQLHITKLKLGSGVVPSGTDIKTLTDLIAPEQNLGIGGKEAVGDYCKISSTISNTGLEAGYYVRELGVFAQDPDDGEILYMYTTDGAPDYLPAGGGSTVISQEFSVMIAVDDTDNIVVDIDPAALATMGYVQLQIQEHNTDTTAHADFTGATAEAAGERGMVPEPQAGDQDKFLTGGKTYVPVASQTEAEGMTDDKKPMTALKVKQLIDKLLGASNGIAGLDVAAKLQSILYDFATELEAQAGTNTTKPINAAGVAAAISALAGGAVIVDELLAQNGYVKFSNGLILQWGYLSFSAVVTAQKVITYPIALSEIALPVAIAIAESYGNDVGLAINNDCMGNHYSSCEFNVTSYGTQRCVGIIFVVIGK
ncbi:MAG TPA: hypothetical protein H9954_05435 [Candidatus Phascolarctobacterium stercoravium]|nr:hypothetical protein [Candidatus Phascolarctobacterium stercoravium]